MAVKHGRGVTLTTHPQCMPMAYDIFRAYEGMEERKIK
jgi:hypothetical protein